MKKIKRAVYVDFDKTITVDRYWRSLPPEQTDQLQKYFFEHDRMLVGEWMRGYHSAEYINRLAAEVVDVSFEELWPSFVNDCETMHIPANILQCLSVLKADTDCTTVLITGNMDSFTRFTRPALGLDQYFNHISCSFDEGRHKTDDNGKLFVDWAEKIGIALPRSILIDDQEKCCDIFSQLGGTAKQTFSLDHTFEILRELL